MNINQYSCINIVSTGIFKNFIMFPGALLGKWGRDREPDGAYGFMLMIPTRMESNYSVQVPWEAVDKASMFSAFISTRCNN